MNKHTSTGVADMSPAAFGDEIARIRDVVGEVTSRAEDLLMDNWALGATERSSLQSWAMFEHVMGEAVLPLTAMLTGALDDLTGSVNTLARTAEAGDGQPTSPAGGVGSGSRRG